MSKFFKWLKKDKQQEESPVVNDTPLQTTDEQVDSKPEILKNDGSGYIDSTPPVEEITQPEQNKTSSGLELNTPVNRK